MLPEVWGTSSLVLLFPFNKQPLLLHYLENLHGTCLGADSAGDTLGCGGSLLCLHHQAEGTCLHALAAAGAELLIYHVYALGVLGDGSRLAGLGALTALYAHHGLHAALLLHNLDAGFIRIKGFVESLGACAHALQTCHTGSSLLYFQFFHLFILRVQHFSTF